MVWRFVWKGPTKFFRFENEADADGASEGDAHIRDCIMVHRPVGWPEGPAERWQVSNQHR